MWEAGGGGERKEAGIKNNSTNYFCEKEQRFKNREVGRLV